MENRADVNMLNRGVNSNISTIKEQNRSLNTLDGQLNRVDDKAKVTDAYTSGFKSFFGFFPKIFRIGTSGKNSYSKSTTEDKDKNNANNEEEDDDELAKEVKYLNKNAKILRKEIDASINQTEKLDKHIDKTNKLVDKQNKAAREIMDKY